MEKFRCSEVFYSAVRSYFLTLLFAKIRSEITTKNRHNHVFSYCFQFTLSIEFLATYRRLMRFDASNRITCNRVIKKNTVEGKISHFKKNAQWAIIIAEIEFKRS